ncbi:MAG: YicC family protein [Calditrichaeota bacterium]|nr:YicC family protein [Calditrichota bacterium]RQW08529.1 MAG: YicC family protein [Calditrichota bacterium]
MNHLKSMTGFAAISKEYNGAEVTCEIRSVNSRYLEISLRLPRIITDLEGQFKDIIRQKITRGKIMGSINFNSVNSEIQNLKIQPELIKFYKQLLEQIRQEAEIEEKLKLDHLLFFKDVISFEEQQTVDEKLMQFMLELMDETLDNLNNMRLQEGQYLRADLDQRIQNIADVTEKIQLLGKNNARAEYERLFNRIQTLIGEEKLDQNRMEQELALIADKVDITEEVVRMKSHLELFREDLVSGSPVGKKLNFILQEMNRETNTMSNKATIIEISHLVVQLKEEIEKIREQVQNIE